MIIHTVAKGDTIYSISKQYSIPESRIITDNFLDPTKTLTVGQTIIISHPTKTCSVRGGDTLATIAERNNVSVLSLLQNNPQILSGVTPSQTLNIEYNRENSESIIVSAYTGSASTSVIERKLPYISMLHIQNAAYLHGGEINVLKNAEPIISLANQYHAKPILSLEFSFGEDTITEEFIRSSLSAIKSYGFAGIEIQAVYQDNNDRYKLFDTLLALSGVIKENGYLFIAPIIPDVKTVEGTEFLGDISDTIPLWSYIWDDESTGSPVSPIYQVNNALDEISAIGIEKKTLLGIPTFGVEYSPNRKRTTDAAEGLHIAQSHHINSEFDETAKTPFVRYTDRTHGSGLVKTLHYEDARSFSEKLSLVNSYGLGGVNVMSLDYDAPVFWQILNQRFKIKKY